MGFSKVKSVGRRIKRKITKTLRNWTNYVKKVYHEMKAKNSSVKFGDALKEASKRKKSLSAQGGGVPASTSGTSTSTSGTSTSTSGTSTSTSGTKTSDLPDGPVQSGESLPNSAGGRRKKGRKTRRR